MAKKEWLYTDENGVPHYKGEKNNNSRYKEEMDYLTSRGEWLYTDENGVQHFSNENDWSNPNYREEKSYVNPIYASAQERLSERPFVDKANYARTVPFTSPVLADSAGKARIPKSIIYDNMGEGKLEYDDVSGLEPNAYFQFQVDPKTGEIITIPQRFNVTEAKPQARQKINDSIKPNSTYLENAVNKGNIANFGNTQGLKSIDMQNANSFDAAKYNYQRIPQSVIDRFSYQYADSDPITGKRIYRTAPPSDDTMSRLEHAYGILDRQYPRVQGEIKPVDFDYGTLANSPSTGNSNTGGYSGHETTYVNPSGATGSRPPKGSLMTSSADYNPLIGSYEIYDRGDADNAKYFQALDAYNKYTRELTERHKKIDAIQNQLLYNNMSSSDAALLNALTRMYKDEISQLSEARENARLAMLNEIGNGKRSTIQKRYQGKVVSDEDVIANPKEYKRLLNNMDKTVKDGEIQDGDPDKHLKKYQKWRAEVNAEDMHIKGQNKDQFDAERLQEAKYSQAMNESAKKKMAQYKAQHAKAQAFSDKLDQMEALNKQRQAGIDSKRQDTVHKLSEGGGDWIQAKVDDAIQRGIIPLHRGQELYNEILQRTAETEAAKELKLGEDYFGDKSNDNRDVSDIYDRMNENARVVDDYNPKPVNTVNKKDQAFIDEWKKKAYYDPETNEWYYNQKEGSNEKEAVPFSVKEVLMRDPETIKTKRDFNEQLQGSVVHGPIKVADAEGNESRVLNKGKEGERFAIGDEKGELGLIHDPYYYDKEGNRLPYKVTKDKETGEEQRKYFKQGKKAYNASAEVNQNLNEQEEKIKRAQDLAGKYEFEKDTGNYYSKADGTKASKEDAELLKWNFQRKQDMLEKEKEARRNKNKREITGAYQENVDRVNENVSWYPDEAEIKRLKKAGYSDEDIESLVEKRKENARNYENERLIDINSQLYSDKKSAKYNPYHYSKEEIANKKAEIGARLSEDADDLAKQAGLDNGVDVEFARKQYPLQTRTKDDKYYYDTRSSKWYERSTRKEVTDSDLLKDLNNSSRMYSFTVSANDSDALGKEAPWQVGQALADAKYKPDKSKAAEKKYGQSYEELLEANRSNYDRAFDSVMAGGKDVNEEDKGTSEKAAKKEAKVDEDFNTYDDKLETDKEVHSKEQNALNNELTSEQAARAYEKDMDPVEYKEYIKSFKPAYNPETDSYGYYSEKTGEFREAKDGATANTIKNNLHQTRLVPVEHESEEIAKRRDEYFSKKGEQRKLRKSQSEGKRLNASPAILGAELAGGALLYAKQHPEEVKRAISDKLQEAFDMMKAVGVDADDISDNLSSAARTAWDRYFYNPNK